ncbi:hypothetical protein [Sphingomonas albertensis]|uniref:Uncharacterized protein n=1 Tax=Sphingomonas albertensis TaxID=2762591 RepID=A0ABR7ARA9_9SPHN|nr:hypothetical protein [Sphingomonas albertensis]MBC3942990.1 hypothetical protein [Sphingomonas albertensis]
MTRHDLAVAKWKCSFLAKKIVVLRQSAAEPHILGLIALHQSELDQLLAAIATSHDAKDWAAGWAGADTQTDDQQPRGGPLGSGQDPVG